MSAQPSQLVMEHTLDALPELVVPEPYQLRTLRTEDAAAWAGLINRNGELEEWSIERAAPLFAPDAAMSLDHSFFVEHHGTPVATAQLNLHPAGPYAPWPELGWVAVDPAHRGHGLGYVVCLAVMRAAVIAGHTGIYLLTDDHRLPAIRTYLRLGFQPRMHDDTAPARWKSIMEALGQSEKA